MRVLGITAEYNPFHNGHAYHIREAKARTGCDYLVVLQSGDFVQRGTPAIIDKYDRAEAALRNGADMVIELPIYSATASAELFAEGAIKAFRDLGIDAISYGIESEKEEQDTLAAIRAVASYLCEEPEEYRLLLKKGLSEGLSFAAARWNALQALCPAVSGLSSTPNNILGIEYEKAMKRLHVDFESMPIKRIGAYHDTEIKTENNLYSSATAIREAWLHGIFPNNACPDNAEQIYNKSASYPLTADDFSLLLFPLLYGATSDGLAEVFDVSPDFARRIASVKILPGNWSTLAEICKDRSHTRTYVDRCLCHMLLNITKADAELYRNSKQVPYLHVLGVKQDALGLLGSLSEQSKTPLLTRLSRDIATLDTTSMGLFQKELRATAMYRQVLAGKGYVMPDEMQQRFMIVK